MPSKKRFSPIRWTLGQAGSEFGISPKTVSQRVKAAGVLPGSDRRFSTRDIHRSICGDAVAERVALTRAQRLRAEVDLKTAKLNLLEREGVLINVDEAERRLRPALIEARQLVLSSELDEQKKGDLLEALWTAFEKNWMKPAPAPDGKSDEETTP